MKRVKTALLFNDKYKQGYSYIMSRYTSTFTAPDGTVTNSVLDTITNTQTITVTAPTGQVATTTVNPTDVNSNFDNIVTNLGRQLNEQGAGGGTGVGLRGITSGINYTTANVTQQEKTATATSEATGNPPPDEKQPIPVSTANNPEPPPPSANPQIESTTSASVFNPNVDPNTNIGAEIQTPVPQDDGVDPYVSNGTTTIEPSPQDDGVDPYVSNGTSTIIPEPQDDGVDPYVSNGSSTIEPVPQDDGVDPYVSNGASTIPEAIESPSSITENVFDPTGNNGAPQVEENVFDPTGNQGASRGLSAPLENTRSKATQQDVSNFQAKPDWRVRLSLAPGATYLYKDKSPGILEPLAATDGVIFPYTPAISVQYSASYDPAELTHSNYKFFTYRGSAVDSINITCDFTAQDTFEANYLLAVIHFFRSVTKMFYGQDQNPKIGTPPPLCYLSGLGAFQFDAHPLAITSFNYSLPTEVDYIRAGSTPTPAGVSKAPANIPINSNSVSGNRAGAAGLVPGGLTAPPQFTPPAGSREVTYVPTKMQISIQAVPIVTRNDISNKFSLKEYATGKLLRGTQRQGGGIW